MKSKNNSTSSIKAFDNSSLKIDSLTIESQEDRVALYGSLDITKDKLGLEKITDLVDYLNTVKYELEALMVSKKLPDKETIKSPTMKSNPMG